MADISKINVDGTEYNVKDATARSGLENKAASSHTHETSEVNGLDTALAAKAASTHTHETSEVDGLETALAAKASLNGSSSETFAASLFSLKDGNLPAQISVVSVGGNTLAFKVYTPTNGKYIMCTINKQATLAIEPIVTSDTSSTAITLDKDIIYDLGTLSRNVVLSLPSSYTDADEFEFRFTAATGYSIDLPSGLKMANETTWEATDGYTYQVIICGGFVYFGYITPSTAATE